MLRSRSACRAEGCPQDHGYIEFAAGHVVNLRRLIHQLVHRQCDEVAEHDVHHRAHTGHGGADADAADARFRNGRINHALSAKFGDQTREHLEGVPASATSSPMINTRVSRRISSASASLIAWAKVISRAGFLLFGCVSFLAAGDDGDEELLGIDMLIDLAGVRVGSVQSEVNSSLNVLRNLIFDFMEELTVCHLALL